MTTLASGKQIPAETVMYSAGRQGQTDHLDLANAGLEADNRGRIFVDDNFATKVDHIYAVGDVIGFPAWPRRRWNRAGWPPITRSVSRPKA